MQYQDKSGVRQFSKVMEVCPNCRNTKPKELVELRTQPVEVKTFNTTAYVIIGLITCGIGFLFFPLFNNTTVREVGGGLGIYCHNCNQSFPSRS